MPEVLFLHKGLHAASTRYRALQYFDCLRDAGWVVSERTVAGSASNYLAALRIARRVDVVVVLKKPFKSLFRCLLRRAASKLVFDFDDAIYVRDSGDDSPRRRRQFQKMLAQCDDVWAGNRELLVAAQPFASRSCLLPTTLNPARYTLAANLPDTGMDMVWIGGSASRPWLESILPTLEKAAQCFPGLRLKIVADFSLASEWLEIIEVPWSEKGEVPALAEAHIGIAPLPNHAFTRGKCGLKTLQYMAAGLPVIASSTGVQVDMVRHGVSGFLADDHQAWLQAIERLTADAVLRQSMGRAGRAICEQRYDIEAGCEKMLKRLTRLVSSHGKLT